MEGKSRFAAAVLGLFTVFVLVCGTWFLARTSSPEPYQVNTVQRPAEEDVSAPEEAEEDSRPDSLLPGETINVNTADAYDLQRLPGIGEKRRNALLKQFKSIKAIKAASLAQLQEMAAVYIPQKTIQDTLKELEQL